MRRIGRGARTGVVAGVVAAVAALGAAEPVAVLAGPGSSPVVAVGLAVIDRVPRPVKDFGIRTFGQHDKQALLAGVFVLLALFAIGCGLLARWRPLAGVGGVVLFGVVGALAAATRPEATALYPLPSVIGAVAGAGALFVLARALRMPKTRSGEASPDGRRGPDRRRFLALNATVLAVSALLAGVGRFLAGMRNVAAERQGITLPAPASPAPPLPAGTDLRLPNLTPFLTPTADFYRVDTALQIPQLSVDDYRLRIHGRVRRPLTLSYQDLLRRDLVERVVTLSCVSNEVGGELAGTGRWLGVRLDALLDEVEPDADADQVLSTSADGWTCGTPTGAVRDGRDAMLVVGLNGEPLPLERGYPVRMLVPGLYGYVSATKWVVDLELTRFADARPYWVRRGWRREAPIKTFSRIDTPRPLANVPRGRVAVAGVAWAQHRGVAGVDVRVDGGAWSRATLAAVPSADTWRQWRWEWDSFAAGPGRHTLEVRATDATGHRQPEARRPPFPDGATGWHSVVVRIA